MPKAVRNKALKIREIPVPPDKHPQAPNPVLMKHEFTAGLIAPKGSGKTTMLCNLLDFYRGQFHSIIIFSPTVHNDEKWDWVKRQRLLVENLPLKIWIRQQLEKRKQDQIVQPLPRSNAFEGLVNPIDRNFDGIIPEDCFYENYTDQDLVDILNEQDAVIKLLKKYGKTKYLANRLLFIFDDLVGSTLFGNQRDNTFKMFNVRHRHYSASILMVSQGYKEIPKTIRTGWSALILFEIPNDKELEVIFEEFSMGMPKQQWLEAYMHCTDEDYGFIFFNFQRPRKLRVMNKFNAIIFFEKEKKSVGQPAKSIKEIKEHHA